MQSTGSNEVDGDRRDRYTLRQRKGMQCESSVCRRLFHCGGTVLARCGEYVEFLRELPTIEHDGLDEGCSWHCMRIWDGLQRKLPVFEWLLHWGIFVRSRRFESVEPVRDLRATGPNEVDGGTWYDLWQWQSVQREQAVCGWLFRWGDGVFSRCGASIE